MAYSPGDIVQLKSGGAAMTVVSETPEGVRCIWHGAAAGDLHSAVIPAACLDLLELDDDEFELEELDDEVLDDDEDEIKPPQKGKREH